MSNYKTKREEEYVTIYETWYTNEKGQRVVEVKDSNGVVLRKVIYKAQSQGGEE